MVLSFRLSREKNRFVHLNFSYCAVFLTAALSAAAPPPREVFGRYDGANIIIIIIIIIIILFIFNFFIFFILSLLLLIIIIIMINKYNQNRTKIDRTRKSKQS